MRQDDLLKPAVPAAYARLILELTDARGVDRAVLLDGLGITPALLAAGDARLSLVQVSRLLYRAVQRSGDGALGYAIGLHSNLTTHGFIGYGMLTNATPREAIEFGARFLPLRLPNLGLSLHVEGEQAVIEVRETTPHGALRQCMLDLFLAGIARIGAQMTGYVEPRVAFELWFDYPEPPYYAQWRERLPPARFGMGACQLRFPARLLDRRLPTADVVSTQLVSRQCEDELAVLGYGSDLPERVRAALARRRAGYPDLAAVARALHSSTRTLKRHLRGHGTTFQALLDDVRARDASRLLADPTLPIGQVAQYAGFDDPANFTRAFRRWTGQSPSAFRARATGGAA